MHQHRIVFFFLKKAKTSNAGVLITEKAYNLFFITCNQFYGRENWADQKDTCVLGDLLQKVRLLSLLVTHCNFKQLRKNMKKNLHKKNSRCKTIHRNSLILQLKKLTFQTSEEIFCSKNSGIIEREVGKKPIAEPNRAPKITRPV